MIPFKHFLPACPQGWWGQNCQTPCSGCSTCNDITGVCQGKEYFRKYKTYLLVTICFNPDSNCILEFEILSVKEISIVDVTVDILIAFVCLN